LLIAFIQDFEADDVRTRFQNLARDIDVPVPPSFIYGTITFKERLQEEVGSVYQFFQPLNRENEQRQTLLIPTISNFGG